MLDFVFALAVMLVATSSFESFLGIGPAESKPSRPVNVGTQERRRVARSKAPEDNFERPMK
jgi:hypothetical protein